MMKTSNLLIYFHKIKSVTNLADKRKKITLNFNAKLLSQCSIDVSSMS